MLPNFRSLTDSSCLLYDLPGLEDTRGSSYEILNASFIKNIVENAKTVGFIFIDHKTFSSVIKGIPNILCVMYNQTQRWTMDIGKNIDAKNDNVKNNY